MDESSVAIAASVALCRRRRTAWGAGTPRIRPGDPRKAAATTFKILVADAVGAMLEDLASRKAAGATTPGRGRCLEEREWWTRQGLNL